ncbi:MAG: aminotransferase class III-fold pyridoxal phosphate-dependent enzyme [Clostridiales bacterium]|nr:aminotransferase class III-fold pyridoxal phosphate-dependent enzyme [Clostridiales bacterium]
MTEIKKIETTYRRIISEIPHPESLKLIEELRSIEPRSMSGFSPIVWDRAQGFQVWDAYGNRWIDFTSAVVLANAGHANLRIGNAIAKQLESSMWHSYCNPSQIRLHTVQTIKNILPDYLNKVFLLTTGSEAVECAIKLIRIYGREISRDKINILSFYNSFHGRTMASQSAGGFMDQQEWMGQRPAGFIHIPFPECARCPWGKDKYERCGKECLERSMEQIRKEGVQENLFAGVITETFQGPTVAFMPEDYAAALREWADEHKALLVFDEIQAGIGRTGKWFGFEHYGVKADLITMGKGMTSCLPMSAVAGRNEIMDIPEHGEMSSTHTGNPLCCAAAIANIETIKEERLIENAVSLEKVASVYFSRLKERFPGHIGVINGKGLVWAIYLLKPGTKELNVDLAKAVTKKCMESGLLMLQTGRGTLKIAPPLCINEEAFIEGINLIGETLNELIC